MVEAVRDHEDLKDRGHVAEPPDVVDGRPEVEPLEHIRQGVEADHLPGAFGHYRAEGLEARQGPVPFQSGNKIKLINRCDDKCQRVI